MLVVSLPVVGLRHMNVLSFIFVVLRLHVAVNKFGHNVSCVNKSGGFIALMSTQRQERGEYEWALQ